MGHRAPLLDARFEYARRLATLVRLHELESQAVGFADREILLAVALAEREIRRQRPDTFRIVVRVARIAVDIGAARELEARGFGEPDDALLGDVAVARGRVFGLGI